MCLRRLESEDFMKEGSKEFEAKMEQNFIQRVIVDEIACQLA